MLIFPAIDLYQKQAVRLYKGDYAQKTVYSSSPLSVAKDFEQKGATWVHVVDLEGAKSGETPNLDVVIDIVNNTGLNVEVGGGIRTMQTARRYLSAGVSRIILGTAAVRDPLFLQEALSDFGDKVAVGVDIADGMVAVNGWTEKSSIDVWQMFQNMQAAGVGTIICTDISRDGAMRGSNRALYRALSEKYDVNVIASGGVSSMDDIRELSALNLYGAIVGKAYYEGAIDLALAIKEAK